MPGVITLAATGNVSTNSATPGVPSSVFGTQPAWGDGLDSSGATLQGIYSVDVTITGSGEASIPAASIPDLTLNPERVQIFVRLRMGSTSGLPLPLVNVQRVTGEVLLNGGQTGTSPAGPTVVDIPVAGNVAAFLYDRKTGTVEHRILVATPIVNMSLYSPGNYAWTIYEASVRVVILATDAPPCRIFPRSDGLGVGAGRNYPPPKSQQRSNRGVGYY